MPMDNDVVCGKGKAVMVHPGTKRFRALVRENTCQYSQGNKLQRREICKFLVNDVLSNGGRFLKHDGVGSWIIVEYEDAVKKTSRAFLDWISIQARKKTKRVAKDSRRETGGL